MSQKLRVSVVFVANGTKVPGRQRLSSARAPRTRSVQHRPIKQNKRIMNELNPPYSKMYLREISEEHVTPAQASRGSPCSSAPPNSDDVYEYHISSYGHQSNPQPIRNAELATNT